MKRPVDPSSCGLSKRTELVEIDGDHLAIVKKRKSRIIMKDGEQIFHQAETLRRGSPGMKVSVMTDAPLCSKTVQFLKERGIEVIPLK